MGLQSISEKIGYKLALVALAFFVVGLAAVGVTFSVSWELEGGAAAINDIGSLRMRTYRMAYLAADYNLHHQNSDFQQRMLKQEIPAFEQTLERLRVGDPSRPLFLPRIDTILGQRDTIDKRWRGDIKPMLLRVAQSEAYDGPAVWRSIDRYVDEINALVLSVEHHNSRNTTLMRVLQFGLIGLAVAGTIILVLIMHAWVVRPVQNLHAGIRRMEEGDFTARLDVESEDEIGEVTLGFNRMAERLQQLYDTLEQDVRQKIETLERKNRELTALYEVTSLISRPNASKEEICSDVLGEMIKLMDASAGAVRITERREHKVHFLVEQGVNRNLLDEEECIQEGECLCGDAARSGVAFVRDVDAGGHNQGMRDSCRKAGYATVAAFPISYRQQQLGLFNLYFKERRHVTNEERRLLKSFGQHLGAAIEGVRMVSQEKEIAVYEERNLLAQELHDSIAQALAFLNLQVQFLDAALAVQDTKEAKAILESIREGVQESYDDVRELLVHFRTRVKHDDLEGALRGIVKRFEAQTGVETRLEVYGSGPGLTPEQQIQALHIVQEALSNVRKHARASVVTVRMDCGRDYVFSVSDNGLGFDPGEAEAASETHVGLRIMRERVQRVGGRVTVETNPGEGTKVVLILPVARMEAA